VSESALISNAFSDPRVAWRVTPGRLRDSAHTPISIVVLIERDKVVAPLPRWLPPTKSPLHAPRSVGLGFFETRRFGVSQAFEAIDMPGVPTSTRTASSAGFQGAAAWLISRQDHLQS